MACTPCQLHAVHVCVRVRVRRVRTGDGGLHCVQQLLAECVGALLQLVKRDALLAARQLGLVGDRAPFMWAP